MDLGKMVGDSRVAALASAWGALNKRLGTTPSLGSPRGFVEILHHLNQALTGPRERWAGEGPGSINSVVATAVPSDLALSALEAWAFFAKNVIPLPAHRAWPRVGASLTSSHCILQPPHQIAVSSLEEDAETGAQRGDITALGREGAWRVVGLCVMPPPRPERGV